MKTEETISNECWLVIYWDNGRKFDVTYFGKTQLTQKDIMEEIEDLQKHDWRFKDANPVTINLKIVTVEQKTASFISPNMICWKE